MKRPSVHQNRVDAIIRPIRTITMILSLFASLTTIAIAHDSSLQPNPSKQLKSAERLVYKKQYKKAITTLKKVTKAQPRNADAWNLLGFASRNINQLEAASRAYENALNVNPEHKGALEYQGQLFIFLKDFDAANENLRKLETLCPAGCEELDYLQQALAKT